MNNASNIGTTVAAYASHAQRPLVVRALLFILIAALTGLLCIYTYLSLQWPMMREGHFLHYIAYLINEHNYAPYRDILETSWFGTFLFHLAIGKIFGYQPIDFRHADLVFLALLLLITGRILSRFDKWQAWIGTLSAGLTYLHYGPANTLQRDYILLLPILLSLLVTLQTHWRVNTRALLIGLCFGAAVSIKPHAIIGLPVVLAFLYTQAKKPHSVLQILYCCGAGGLLMLGAGLLWLWWRGGLSAFIDMTLNYLPLYQSLNGAHQVTTPAERWQNTVRWWHYFLWIWPYTAGIGLLYGWMQYEKNSTQRALMLSLVGLMICYNIYPLVSGKFWDYHWIPYSYFSILCTSFLLIPTRKSHWSVQSASVVLIFYFFYALRSQYMPWTGYLDQIKRYPDISVNQSFDKKVSAFIREHLPPGEKIQVIDQGGPSTIYLLQANAALATPYLGSFMFLHDVKNSSYVQHAQIDFLKRLESLPPALFLVMADFTRPSGEGTIKDIPGLKPFLQENYTVIWQHPAFAFWQRKDLNAPALPAAPTTAPDSALPSPP